MADYYINPLNTYSPAQFTDEQKKILLRYFTNLDKPVYAFTNNMPTEVAGALISRFSRSDLSPRQLFWEEFLKNPDLNLDSIGSVNLFEGEESAKERAGKFFKQVLAKYGDESVAEMTGVYVVVEKASTIAIKVIESMRRMAFIEQSTRYIDLTEKVQGEYVYYRDEKLINTLGKDLEAHADKLYDKFREWSPKVKQYVTEQNPKNPEDTEMGYTQAVHARTCDILRELLPISLRATIGVYGFGRDWSDLVNIMRAHNLDEVRELGKMISEEVSKIIPNIMDRSSGTYGQATQQYYRDVDQKLNETIASSVLNTMPTEEVLPAKSFQDNKIEAKVRFVSNYPMERIAAGIMYNKTNHEFNQIFEYFKLNPAKTKDLLDEINNLRKSRFDKVPLGFETVRVSVEFTAPWSCWKDIQRHRRLSEFKNTYFIKHGFYIAPELQAIGLAHEYAEVMQDTLDYIKRVQQLHPEISQQIEYLVPHGANYRWSMDMDFAEAVYMIELRSSAAGHMTYRALMHEFHKGLKKINPNLAKLIKFVDLNFYYLGRRESFNKVVKKGANLD